MAITKTPEALSQHDPRALRREPGRTLARRQPRVRQRQLRKDQTRQHLLSTARQLFAERGFVQTTTLDIARAAQVSHGTVFVHFATREGLIEAVIEGFANDVGARMRNLAQAGAPLREVLRAHLDGLIEHEQLYTRLIAERPTLPTHVKALALGIQSAFSFQLAEAMQQGRAAEDLAPMPQHLLFNTWLGLVHHYLLNADVFAPGESVLRRHGSALLDHFASLVLR